ncbi:GGDEF domain-containing protein [Deinococcus depolymerans]|uniref:GGDEF domain-containing protein n=1 Tax=Deinococcus depolymerans TaxID=392408 RepID=A0ABN1CPR4_9DEIO
MPLLPAQSPLKARRDQRYSAHLSLALLSTGVHGALLWYDLTHDRQTMPSLTGAVILSAFLTATVLSRRIPLDTLTTTVAYALPVWVVLQVVAAGLQGQGVPPAYFLSLGVVGLLAFVWLPLAQAVTLLLPVAGFMFAAVLLFNPQDLPLMLYSTFLIALMGLLTLHGQLIGPERARRLSQQRLAHTDSLTGLLNRQGGRAALQSLTASPLNAARVAAVLVDIDGFGTLNTRLGPEAADQLLVEFAGLLGRVIPPGSVLARWDADAFVLILTDVGMAGAHDAAERVVRAARNLNLPHLNGAPVSAGVAFAAETEDPDALMDLCAQRLGQARAAGGNRWA